MYCVELGLFLLGMAVLVVGYRKNHRRLLVCAAVVWFVAGAANSAVQGFVEGYGYTGQV